MDKRLLATVMAASSLVACAAEDSPGDRSSLPVQMGSGSGAAGGAGMAIGSGGGAGNTATASGGMGSAGMSTSPLGGSGGSAGRGTMNGGDSGMGGSGMGGAGGGTMVGVGGSGSNDCPAPPAGATPQAIAALNAVNAMRVPSGSGCASMVAEINTAATNHCNYYAMNKAGGSATAMCIANPHNEVMGCAGFTGTGPGQRMMAAGYNARGYSEVMAFVNDPEDSVATWINSVWHRIPILDPWTTLLGYGNATGCDTIDFAPGMGATDDTVVVYPYDGQTGVPTSFNGMYEGPMPPAPPTGWPSAAPITVYAKGMTVTEHVLTLDGNDTPIEHVWITGMDPMWGQYLRTAVFMYGNAPFAANTKYRVRVKGTHTGGTLDLDWTFTTGAGGRRP